MQSSSPQETNEISIKVLIIRAISLKNELLKRWKTLFLYGLIGAILGLSYALLSKKKYTAELTFALEEKAGGASAYAGIASQFGLDLGKGEGGAFAGDNIMELFKSRIIIQNSLLTPVMIDGKLDILMNRYIVFNELNEKWAAKDETKDLKFIMGQPQDSFTRQQDSVLIAISEGIKKKDLLVDKIDKKLSIVKVSVSSKDEMFAKLFTEVLARNVRDLYVESKTKKSKKNIAVLEARVDSVRNELYSDMVSIASNQDANQNVVKARVRVPQAKQQINVQLLSTLYGELVKNLELSKLALLKEEPVIQLIDRPMYPLKYTKPGKLTSMIIGGFLGVLIFVGTYLFKGWYLRIMQENDAHNLD